MLATRALHDCSQSKKSSELNNETISSKGISFKHIQYVTLVLHIEMCTLKSCVFGYMFLAMCSEK